MKFAIRDDDINYFTNPEDLETIYGNIWNKCPISLSIVPFHASVKSGAIPPKYWTGDAIFPIDENKRLIKFLKEKIKEGKISIMLHGYSHKDYENGHEFEVGDNLEKKVKEGKEYLEQLFKIQVTTFVPPHNVLSRKGLLAVVNNGLNILNIPSFRPGRRVFHFSNIIPFIKLRIFYIRHPGRRYPYVISLSDHNEINCYPLVPQTKLEELEDDFKFCSKMDGVFCLATHYWEMKNTKSMIKKFNKFWEYINIINDNIYFLRISDIL